MNIKILDPSFEEAIVDLELKVYKPIGGPIYGHAMTGMVFSRPIQDRLTFGAFTSEGKLVGYLLAALETDQNSRFWYIVDFAVHPKYQRQGIGHQLSAALAEAAIPLDIIGDDFKPSYFHDTRKGFWEKFGYHVIVQPGSSRQVRVVRRVGSAPKLRCWYLHHWEADRIAQLEKKVYPSAFRCGEEDFRDDLRHAEATAGNFSRGYINPEGDLVAYLVAFKQQSEEHGDIVVYGSDVAVHPSLQHQGLGGRLIMEVLRSAAQAGLPCEGECRAESYVLLRDHPAVLVRLGYRLAESHVLPDYNAGEDHWWIRLELTTSALLAGANRFR